MLEEAVPDWGMKLPNQYQSVDAKCEQPHVVRETKDFVIINKPIGWVSECRSARDLALLPYRIAKERVDHSQNPRNLSWNAPDKLGDLGGGRRQPSRTSSQIISR